MPFLSIRDLLARHLSRTVFVPLTISFFYHLFHMFSFANYISLGFFFMRPFYVPSEFNQIETSRALKKKEVAESSKGFWDDVSAS